MNTYSLYEEETQEDEIAFERSTNTLEFTACWNEKTNDFVHSIIPFCDDGSLLIEHKLLVERNLTPFAIKLIEDKNFKVK